MRAHQSLHFEKIPGGPNIDIILCENWHAAFIYIREQTQKNKFDIWVLKITILDPRKSGFYVFEKNTPQNVFFMFQLCSSF